MPKVQISIARRTGCKIKRSWFKKVIAFVLSEEKITGNVMVDLLVTGERQIRHINKMYRRIDRATDVLSFSFLEKKQHRGKTKFPLEADGNEHLGEIIISFPRAIKQANRNGYKPEIELIRLITHGMLHLLGYDHKKTADAAKMMAREQLIMEEIKGNLEER